MDNRPAFKKLSCPVASPNIQQLLITAYQECQHINCCCVTMCAVLQGHMVCAKRYMTVMTESCWRQLSPEMTAHCWPGWSLLYDLLLHARGASHPALSSWQRLRAGHLAESTDQEETVNDVKRKCKNLEGFLAELFNILFSRTSLQAPLLLHLSRCSS